MSAVMQKQKLSQNRTFWAWAFILPTLCTIFLVAGFPLYKTIHFSFTDATLDTLDDFEYVGLKNYAQMMGSSRWWNSVWLTVKFTFFSVALETALGLFVALFLHHEFKGRGMLRVAILVPWAIPTVVSSQIWVWLYHDQYGVINHVLIQLGLVDPGSPVAFMGNPDLVLPTIIAVDVSEDKLKAAKTFRLARGHRGNWSRHDPGKPV